MMSKVCPWCDGPMGTTDDSMYCQTCRDERASEWVPPPDPWLVVVEGNCVNCGRPWEDGFYGIRTEPLLCGSCSSGNA